MSGLRPLPARVVERALKDLGFVRVRSRGSHVVYHHADGRRTVVAHHSDRDVPRGTLRNVLKDLRLSWEEFEKLL